MNRRTAYRTSLFFNTIIFVIEAFTLSNRMIGYLPYSSDYFNAFNYTDLYMKFDITANIFLAFASLIMMAADIKYLRNMKNYRRATNFAIIMKLCSVILSLIVLVTVYGYYYPIVWEMSTTELISNALEFHYSLWAYTVLPVLALISFVFFDIDPKVKFVKSLYVFIPVLGYFGTIFGLSYFGIIQCPYKLLDPRNIFSSIEDYPDKDFMGSIITYCAIVFGSYLLAALIFLLRNHHAKKCEKIGEEYIADGVGDIPSDLLDKTSRKEYRASKKQAKLNIKNERRAKKGKAPIVVKSKAKEEKIEETKVKPNKNKKEKKNKKELKAA